MGASYDGPVAPIERGVGCDPHYKSSMVKLIDHVFAAPRTVPRYECGVTIIEPFSPGWEDAIVGLIVPIQQQEFRVPIRAEDQPDLRNIPTVYQTGRGNFWIARDTTTNQVVGTIGLIDFGAGAALRKMFLRSDQRGSGVAQALLERLVQHAALRAIDRIYLGTLAQMHAAHRFYEKNGFHRIAPEALPADFPRMVVDDRFYARRL